MSNTMIRPRIKSRERRREEFGWSVIEAICFEIDQIKINITTSLETKVLIFIDN